MHLYSGINVSLLGHISIAIHILNFAEIGSILGGEKVQIRT